MKNRKETIKTCILVLLVLLSIFLSYVITTYRPDYEIFNRKTEQKDKNTEEKLSEVLNIVSPDIIYKEELGAREEQSIQNTITKVAKIEGLKNRNSIKSILSVIAGDTSVETRVKKDAKDIINIHSEKIVMDYGMAFDSAIVKPIFFGEENNNVTLEFKKVLLLKEKPSSIFLYKNEESNYIQVDLKDNIYDKVDELFNKYKESYGKYSLNNKVLYIPEYTGNYYIDEYSVEDIDINKLARQIFQGGNFRNSGNELTDGYSILRQTGDRIFYVNPSNEVVKPTINLATLSYAVDFLTNAYLQDTNYKVLETTERYSVFQEVYKDAIAIDEKGFTTINIQSNTTGVYQAVLPVKYAKTLLSSKKMEDYEVARTEYIINYLYANVNLREVEDITLGYKKQYVKNNASFTYRPTWYIKYKGRYVDFKSLKESVEGRVT